MAKDDHSDMREIAKRQLDGRGYIVRLSTAREGQNTIGRVHVTDAATDKTIAKFVGVGKFDDLELVFGFDATEGVARDFLSQAMSLAELLRYLVPGLSLREE